MGERGRGESSRQAIAGALGTEKSQNGGRELPDIMGYVIWEENRLAEIAWELAWGSDMLEAELIEK